MLVAKDKELRRQTMIGKWTGKKVAVLLCAALMTVLAGCGGQNAETGAVAEYEESQADGTEEAAEDAGSAEPENDAEDTKTAQEESGDDGSAPETESGSDAATESTSDSGELEGYVVSVDKGNKFAVVDRICTETLEEGGDLSYNTGEMIRVYFQDDIPYTLEEITDGGENVVRTEADFSDIREDDMLRLKGKRAVSEQSGDEFLSSEVTIVRVK